MAIEVTICHKGGLITAIRNIISVGAKKGIIESSIDDVLLGFDITIPKSIIGITINMVTGNCTC